MTHARPPLRLRLMPVLRRVLAVVLALSFPTAVSVPAQAMGPQCEQRLAMEVAAASLVGHDVAGAAAPLAPPSAHPANHPAALETPQASKAQMMDTGAPGSDGGILHACCLAACPACLPAVVGASVTAAPAARESLTPHATLLPDGLPPGEAFDPPRSAQA
ncbi:hypothetical protein J5J86_21105 [Aquabacter sp. L1I39]|uniref:hypothetical protein n=1 Tax=Aquabacter sp. L1I39 TaxID=2820278 RepID=UPI001ADD0962|nr:hypothetical protein [Aquabacter sp. L1I39]QTL03220.1 hypothetical protein J5J86_21105 [Aquabacter sp. L1I39]